MPRIKGRKPEETRAAIMQAAVRVFAAHGYRSATLAVIAKEAGVTAATVPYHFADKRGLWDAVLAEFYDALLSFGRGLRVEQPLDALLGELYLWCEGRRHGIRVILRNVLETGGLDASVSQRMGPALHFVSLLASRRFGVPADRARDAAIALSHLIVRFITNDPEDNRLSFGEETVDATRGRILDLLGTVARTVMGLPAGDAG